MLDRKDLVINREYQRGARLWPAGPRSYFIDTILSNFPFPKIYFYEYLTAENRRTKRELVDGQQRVQSIMDFVNDKYRLTGESRGFAGSRFSDLDAEVQDTFLSYTVPVDVIRNATKSDILQMFRRMNAYTLPLNNAEKRHSTFQGAFKWMINRLSDEFSATFVEFGIFTNRQIVRMADAELLTDMVLSLERGIVSTSDKSLRELYETYDNGLSEDNRFEQRLREFFEYLVENFGQLRNTHLMKSYVIHSLFSAAMQNRYGLPEAAESLALEPIGQFGRNVELAREGLRTLAAAHETNDEEGDFGEYVWSCNAATTRENRRVVRIRYLALALRGELLGE
jgi:hypothetical protein